MSRSSETVPSLDGLRGVSILVVMIGHGVAETRQHPLAFNFLFDHALLGVHIFFIISGYLITLLLLRERAAFGGISLKHFYTRRALRILPAFYAYVLCVVVLDHLNVITLPKHNLLYVLTYTSNLTPRWSWFTGHLWSLSVEEQFYLLWPLALTFFTLRTCTALAAAAVAAPIVIRLTFLTTGIHLIDPALPFAFPVVCAPIAMGCLLAIAEPKIKRIFVQEPLLGAVIPFVITLTFWLDMDEGTFTLLAADVLLALLVARCIFVPADFYGRVLNSRPLMFLGTLSYSLYLWQQLFLQHQTNWTVRQFPYNLLAIAALAAASYFLLERPLLNLRRRFRRSAPAVPAPELIVTARG